MMDKLTQDIMDNMKQTDSKLGLDLIKMFTEAYLGAVSDDKKLFFRERILELLVKMEYPVFAKDPQ